MEKQKLTGYPSVDKPWLNKYPKELLRQREKPSNSIYKSLRTVWWDLSEIIINYYDTPITSGEFFSKVQAVAKSLTALGVKKGDSIPVSLEAIPEFLELLLACEMLGVSLKSYMGDTGEILSLINLCSAKVYFTYDYLLEETANTIYEKTRIQNIITIPPLFSVTNEERVQSHILRSIDKKYSFAISKDRRNILWKEFLQLGSQTPLVVVSDPCLPLYSAFTSGSTGEPKEVIHTAGSLLGVVHQLILFPFKKGNDSWLLTILPPTLVAVVASMMIYPLLDGKLLILDPYCALEDLDLEMMHYRPTSWGLIPIFLEALLESKRIPKDYDMSYFKLFGFGAEPISRKMARKVQAFLDRHNSKAIFGSGYGQSEGGSDFTVCFDRELILSGSAGIPLIETTMSIFKPGTTEELKYGEIGEICKSGPGLMLGYGDKKRTTDVLKRHSDGQVWLHTGDYGYMTPEGLLFVLGREAIHVYPGNDIYPISVEEKILVLESVKEAVIISSDDKAHPGFQLLNLFLVPECAKDKNEMVEKIKSYLPAALLPEERPSAIFVIEKKPISHFKTDRSALKRIAESVSSC